MENRNNDNTAPNSTITTLTKLRNLYNSFADTLLIGNFQTVTLHESKSFPALSGTEITPINTMPANEGNLTTNPSLKRKNTEPLPGQTQNTSECSEAEHNIMFPKPNFGAASTNAFGFGNTTTPNPFGQSSQLFGKPAGSTFGSAAPTFGQPGGTSLFPGSQPQSSGLFQTASTPAFGATNTNQSGFGSNLFGNAAAQPSGSGLFGSSTFGQQNKPAGFGFGATATQPNLFGQTQTAPTQNASLFQPSTSANLFGSGGTFGAATQTGTVIKFTPLTGTDTMQKGGVTSTINTKHHCITCMKEYENKSLEELRFEDYQANRKGPQQQAGFGGTPFGAPPAAAPSIFGQTDNKPGFGQTPGFGSAATGFGLAAQPNVSQGLFGKPATGFGSATTTAVTFGFNSTVSASPFGASTVAKPFGAQTTQPLFGAATTQQTPSFGSTMFGQQNTQNTGGIFGKPAQPTTGFSAGQSNFSFGPPAATQSSSLFSAPKPNTAFPSFGQTNTVTSSFGQQQPFGQQNQSTFGSTFGKPIATGFAQPTQPTFSGGLGMQQGSLFGNTAKPGGLFGTSNSLGLFGSNQMQPSTTFNLQPQQQQNFQSETQPQDIRSLLNVGDYFGHTGHLSSLMPRKPDYSSRVTNPREIEAILKDGSLRSVDTASTSKIKAVPLTVKHSIFDGILGNSCVDSNKLFKKSCRRLLIDKNRRSENGWMSPPHISIDDIEETVEDEITESRLFVRTNKSDEAIKKSDAASHAAGDAPLGGSMDISGASSGSRVLSFRNKRSPTPRRRIATIPNIDQLEELLEEDNIGDGLDTSSNDSITPRPDPSAEKKNNCGVVLTRAEYYTIPPLDELDQYVDEEGRCMVEGFTIGRIGYGNLYFPDRFDISNLNLDELVYFRHKEVTVYLDDSKKPPVGEGLNRRAQVTLDRVWPRSKENNKIITNPKEIIALDFSENLRKACERLNSKFLEYRPETGSWVFMVDHFSKFSLLDQEEEVDLEKQQKELEMEEQRKKKQQQEAEKMQEEEKELERQQAVKGLGGIRSFDKEFSPAVTAESTPPIRLSDESPMLDDIANSKAMMYYLDRNVQLMKASFFDEDLIPELIPDDSSSTEAIMEQYMDISTPPSPEMVQDIVPVKKYCDIRVFQVNRFYDVSVIVPRNYIDLAVFHGKCFKVGWKQGTVFCAPRRIQEPEEMIEEVVPSRKLEIVNVDHLNYGVKINPAEVIVESLKMLQEDCDVVLNKEGIPHLTLGKPYKFLRNQKKLCERIAKDDPNDTQAHYFRNVWNMVGELWGTEKDTPCNRKYLFSSWLQEVVQSDVLNELVFPEGTGIEKTLEEIYINLTGHRIKEASELAMKHQLPQLSMLLTVCSSLEAKELVQEQFIHWQTSGAIKHIDDRLIKIYLLIGGMPSCGDVNICGDVDWLRAYAIHLWYVCPYHAPLSESVVLYERAFSELGYAKKPLPPYASNLVNGATYDVMYYLLLLFSNKKLLLNKVVDPATYTSDSLDYRLSWLLLQTLTALRVGVISENSKNHVNVSFANQLEQMQYWEYAIFVLLFIKNNSIKKNLVMGVLDRNLTLEFSPEIAAIYDFLVNKIKVPPIWIHDVLANKAKLSKCHWAEFQHLLYAGSVHDCHEIAINKILPSLFANHQYGIAKQTLLELEESQEYIVDWQNRGGLLLEFLRLRESMERRDLKDQEKLTELQNVLFRLCQRIKYFPTETAEQTLCISEVSKECGGFLQSLFQENTDKRNQILANTLCVEELIMPPDYKSLDFEKYMVEYLKI